MFLGWNRAKGAAAAAYTITLPDGAAGKWQLTGQSTVDLSIAALDEDAPLPGKKKDEKDKPEQYRIKVVEAAPASVVSVQDPKGAPDRTQNSEKILALLKDQLK